MHGAFAAVPKSELEAAHTYGMIPWQVLRRIWLPCAFHRALPTLGDEPLLLLALIYLLLAGLLILIFKYLESRIPVR